MLQETFIQLLKNYTTNENTIISMWAEIEKQYTHKKRQYHNLTHLENLLQQLNEIKAHIADWDTMLFALYYHDIVYKTLKNNNEEQSALWAQKKLMHISVPATIIDNCTKQILATKQHLANNDTDTNFFTDADLSILGQNWDTYFKYTIQIRKEYSIYPDLIYKPGRKKVLENFLKMPHIFKTTYFYDKFELKAKQNIEKELILL
jgi:predicted metal-dependent HD superfamily phosphohydrolase